MSQVIIKDNKIFLPLWFSNKIQQGNSYSNKLESQDTKMEKFKEKALKKAQSMLETTRN